MAMNWLTDIQGLANVATAIAVVALFRQLSVSKKQELTRFEDAMTQQYREIARRIPVEALLGGNLEDPEYTAARIWFFQYVDLSNEEIFLRQKRRISKQTWEEWRQGIQTNLDRPAFARAWNEIKLKSPKSFEELRRLEESGFKDDPRSWR